MRRTTLSILYIIGSVFALCSALPSYISSSFLSNFVGEKLVGLVFAVCSLATVLTFISIPKILRRFGNYKTATFVSIINLFSLLGLSFLNNIYEVLFCFVLTYATTTAIILCLDIFIEHNSTDNETGKIRSFYLTGINFAWLISPWLSGMIIGGESYWKVYFISSLLMIPIASLIFYNLKSFKDDEYKEFKVVSTIKEVLENKDIKHIFASSFLLNFFYAWMVIYAPIYLFKYIGFDWATIGLIFTIMLLPFVLIQIPLGKIADKYIGEKEMLTAGFLIMAFSVGFMPFISGKDFWVWSILLFTTRIGAAMVEVMTETYFFKKINDQNTNLISAFRSMSSFAYIIAPLIATVFFLFIPFGYIFLALSLFMFWGLRYSLAIKDTK